MKQTYANYYRDYYHTPSGREAKKRAQRKWRASPKGRISVRKTNAKTARRLKTRYMVTSLREAKKRHSAIVKLREKFNVPV